MKELCNVNATNTLSKYLMLCACAGASTLVASSAAAQAPGEPETEPDVVAEPVEAEPEVVAEPLAGYEKGFFIRSGDGRFELHIKGRVQARYELESFETVDETTMEVVRDEESAFSIPRARLELSGHALTEALSYKFQADFGKGNVTLKDFLVDYRVFGDVKVRVGQWKRPFSRQQINSSGKLELVDRAITDKAFGAGRDIGIAVHNGYEKSPTLEWAVGVFNGTGDKGVFSGEADPMTGEVTGGFSNIPDVLQPAIVGRVGYNANGIKGYSEADLEGGPLRFAVGGSVLAELDADGDDASSIRAEADAVVKVQGISASGAIYYATAQDGPDWLDQGHGQIGFHAQGGYTFARRYQIAARYAMVAPDGPDNDRHEVGVGFSLYQFEHNFKWQTDAALLVAEGADFADDLRVRSQLQLSF